MKKRGTTKRIKFVRPSQIVYAIIIVVAITMISCEIPVQTEQQQIVIQEVVITPETNEEIIMEMNPIKVYEKYAVNENGNVLGINGNVLEPVFLTDTDDKGYQFNEFFVKDGTMFFNVKTIDNTDPENPVEVVKYYFQTGDQITEETNVSAFPDKPVSDFVEMGVSPFSIVTFDYNGEDTSRVIKDIFDEDNKLVKSLPTGFKMIDAYCSTNDGLWFSVPETISIRLKGIYFYPVGGNLSSSPIMSGRIW